jgi:hypothetical protein
MDKKLVRVGNSLAVVLDKPFRHALGIKPTTLVRVMTDGKRIIIEPSGERPVEIKRTEEVSERMRAVAIARELLTYYSLGNELFAEFTCGWPGQRPRLRVRVYQHWLERVEWESLTDGERRVIRRFDVLYSVLRGEKDWPTAIAAALSAEPFDPADPEEQSVGRARDPAKHGAC